jgi:Spore morphogenesis and germination YwcE
MDVFFAYLLIATSTPLFLWKERRTLAIMHIPVVIAMWAVFIANMNADYGMVGHTIFILAFVLNVFIAHMTIFHLFVVPFFKMLKNQKKIFR